MTWQQFLFVCSNPPSAARRPPPQTKWIVTNVPGRIRGVTGQVFCGKCAQGVSESRHTLNFQLQLNMTQIYENGVFYIIY